MTKSIFFSILFSVLFINIYAQQSDLSVEKIMQDPKWMGTFPSNIKWDQNSSAIYFNYNRDDDPSDSLYRIRLKNPKNIEKVTWTEEKDIDFARGTYNSKKTKKIYAKGNTLIIFDVKSDKETELLQFPKNISNPNFLANEDWIAFEADDNAYIYSQETGILKKLTQIKSGEAPKKKDPKSSDKASFLEEENLKLLSVVKEREDNKETSKKIREARKEKEAYTYYSGDNEIFNLQVSPDAKYVTFTLYQRGKSDATIVPNYIDASSYTTDLGTRSKVGDDETKVALAIYNIEKDTVYTVNTSTLPGIKDLPDYVKDYPDKEWEEKEREVISSQAYFSDNGQHAIVNVRSKDNKDRWIAKLDLTSGELTNLDRQRDEAWIAGPGIGWTMGGGTMGWLPDNKHLYFQSEATGYSHLYLLDVTNGKKKALTSGNFEVFDPFMSNDKKNWYLSTSEVGPAERHFYTMPIMGGTMGQLTTMTGNNDVSLSPDEKHMAIRHSYSNQPWELYYKKNSAKAEAEQLTSGQSDAFQSYTWRDPKLITFKAEDGAQVPARLYVPEASVKNNAAVIFVHGAGYLQNVHKWWSSYFREYMFHNLLTDLGYTVIDIDYRGSAGYGRDWRTGIYRHMGGKDLSDQVDGAKYLVDNYGIDQEKIGIYGGSYGGFITLMALFTEAETFTSGAALRSVTDWAHYNHGYTANILNEPFNDPIAYQRSSPIYFAEGLEGNLLMAHGMVDVNVHFQDVVRLSQRLIELGKDNWEMAIYPAEDHGFVEPSSWTDEYKRILKLFNTTLLKK
ncbi:dipeptidyl aminopeptidase/acylaminoacyl peptidase [Gelidibacter algens]|uniref:Dipeptidyl aminopeptidase/acylaminoacyl peptidase n=1 Tax=Gelidibacter algens TaxID=49280 RepID=A0A1A7R2M7_9FLAO|nr:prolyl oligopeptidase family serine peptidase [Gelidibacter algens]OBX25758.1 peptidase S9 [Gelidibacter algens]RAJ21105.1 dipeptidyl aminopeptidase/acylaminoacyl peptidase [Gelidibacter algens]